MELKQWGELMRIAVVTGTVISLTVGLLLGLLGLVFTPRRDFDRLERVVRFNACAVVLDVETCQEAHGLTREDLLRSPGE